MDDLVIETESGGYEIARPLEYAENSTYTRYSGYDTLSVQASDVISAATLGSARMQASACGPSAYGRTS